MGDDSGYGIIVTEPLSDQSRLGGVIFVIQRNQLQHLAVYTAGGVDLLDGDFGPVHHQLAVSGAAAGQRRGNADADGLTGTGATGLLRTHRVASIGVVGRAGGASAAAGRQAEGHCRR